MPVLIKGAGVAGLALAFELTRRGISVAVHDVKPQIGQGASHYAGGMFAPYCEREAAEELVLTLGLTAADWWEDALPGSVTRAGTLVLAPTRDLQDLNRFASRTRGHRWLDADEISALEPDLAGRFRKGLFFADEAHLDPRQALAGLHRALVEQGVAFHLGPDTEPDRHSFDQVIDCTGSAAIGRIDTLRGVRGEMIYLHSPDIRLHRPIRLLHPRHPIYIVPRDNNIFMVGATMIEAEDGGPISARSLMEFLNAAYTLNSAFGEARVIETGVGIRPAFADNLPRVLDNSDGLAIAGMHRHGFLLAPAMARQAADRIQIALAGAQRKRAS
ncbi:glycine oxidase ThiO [Allorhizobium taibaishanense]|uniref:Glycine oxidase n=1 Tax=Allorhizobium taibaishanense TaxID=887144 RepID=A0A1Q9A5W3_9HYPH|nr:glycine oxidase ThiO [Allorhizobium taibaishanense]MBB4008930.1 glycine oxidase [Allorhizobium taibaishanense]OLP49969.1 glycine oxidase ThiO [Allorhizobium taibaishanense]